MPKRLLAFIPPSLRVISVAAEPKRVTVMAVPRSAASCCPVCRRHSDRSNGSYERPLTDLPWQGRAISLCVRLRRLCCRNPACPRRTFSQSLPDVAVPRARRSRRLQDIQRQLGLALGGAPAARLAHRLALGGHQPAQRGSARWHGHSGTYEPRSFGPNETEFVLSRRPTAANRKGTLPAMRFTPNSGAFALPVLPSPALPAISISTARLYGAGCGETSHRAGKNDAPECHRSPSRLSRPVLG